MPKLETLLMRKYKLHYAECRSVVAEERERLGMNRMAPLTPELQEACEQRCAGMNACTQSSVGSLFPAHDSLASSQEFVAEEELP